MYYFIIFYFSSVILYISWPILNTSTYFKTSPFFYTYFLHIPPMKNYVFIETFSYNIIAAHKSCAAIFYSVVVSSKISNCLNVFCTISEKPYIFSIVPLSVSLLLAVPAETSSDNCDNIEILSTIAIFAFSPIFINASKLVCLAISKIPVVSS